MPETPETAMRPEDVADELAKPVAEVLKRHYDSEFDAPHLSWKDFTSEARDIVAAVLPAHEAMVRADERQKAIDEINAKRDAIECNCADDRILRNGLWLAARILEGDLP